MAYTVRGRRIAFDNIAVGSATGRERTIEGVSTSATSAVTGWVERSGANQGQEFLHRTVSGGQVSDRTTDGEH